ncbi:hypothetical protein [Lysinibacillus sp. RC79]
MNSNSRGMVLEHIKAIDKEIDRSKDSYKIAELLKAKSIALLALRTT